MSLKQRLAHICDRLRGRSSRKDATDSELSAEQVAHEEMFPKKRACDTARSGRAKTVRGKGEAKPTAKRGGTRPTNGKYKMIDPSDNTTDAGKS